MLPPAAGGQALGLFGLSGVRRIVRLHGMSPSASVRHREMTDGLKKGTATLRATRLADV